MILHYNMKKMKLCTHKHCKQLFQNLNPQTSHTKTRTLLKTQMMCMRLLLIASLLSLMQQMQNDHYAYVHIRFYVFCVKKTTLLLHEVLSTFNASTSKMKLDGLQKIKFHNFEFFSIISKIAKMVPINLSWPYLKHSTRFAPNEVT